MQFRFGRLPFGSRFRVPTFCFLVVISMGGNDKIQAEEGLSVGRDMTALTRRMDTFIDDLE